MKWCEWKCNVVTRDGEEEHNGEEGDLSNYKLKLQQI